MQLNRHALPAALAALLSATGCGLGEELEVDSTTHEIDIVQMAPIAPDFGLVAEQPPTVDLDQMADNIVDDLKFNVVGFSATIVKDGKVAEMRNWGWAKRGDTDGNLLFSYNRRMQVASVSKTLTAIATLKLLDENGISVDDPVWPWLPDEWSTGAGWKGRSPVTFKHLLTHTSGVDQAFQSLSGAEKDSWGNDWDGLEFVVSRDVVPGSSSSYRNANFALLRVILPAIWTETAGSPAFGGLVTEGNHGPLHVDIMHRLVFNPAGVKSAACWEQPGYFAAYMYNVNDDTVDGHTGNVSYANCGAHAGWHLSSSDLARVMAYLSHDDSYMPPHLRLLMDSQRLGWDKNSNTSQFGREGKHWHGGDWNQSNQRRANACVMTFPGGVEAALIYNSANLGGKYQCTVLKDAYNDALD